MNCPYCRKKMDGIPPLNKEEWICVNDDCVACGREFYGSKQSTINKQLERLNEK